jgi:hypothetical protein
MGYREDLIQRLRRDGWWDQLSIEHQRRFQNLTDDQARQLMVVDDQWEMGDEEAVKMFGLMSLVQVFSLFKGVLVERRGEGFGKLSETGKLFAEFFLQLRQHGLSPDEIDEGLQKLNPMVIAALIAAYKGPALES